LKTGWHLVVPAKAFKVVIGRRNKVFLKVSKSALGFTRATILTTGDSNAVEVSHCSLAQESLLEARTLLMMVVCTATTMLLLLLCKLDLWKVQRVNQSARRYTR
jgi:hypothetical protein